MSDGEMETVKVEVRSITKLQQELQEIQTQIKEVQNEESVTKNKMENLERYANRRENDTFRGQRMPPRDSRRDDRRGRYRDRGRRDGRGDDRRDRRPRGRRTGKERDGGRDRFGRRELDRREQSEETNFYGLARSTGKSTRKKSEERITTYRSQYADAESSSEEEEELPPTQMISLVTVDSDKEDGEKSGGSDSDSDSDSGSEAAVKEEPIPTGRGRKRGREQKGDADRKRRRVNILASMKKDKKNQTRSKRLFGFMMKHLGRAKKESKDKPDLQSSITKKAQELKTQQKRVIDKAFQEKQKEKYEARLEFQRKTLALQKWKKQHIENLLRADGMKQELKMRCDLIDGGIFLTKRSPPIAWRPVTELDQEFMVSLQTECKDAMRAQLDEEIRDMIDNEGEEPEEPEPLPRKYQISPIRGRREDDEQDDKRKKFGLGMKREFGAKREEVSRRDRSRERERPGWKKDREAPRDREARRNTRTPKKDISTRNLRHRRKDPPRRKEGRRTERERSPRTPPPIKEERAAPEPTMMSLVSVAED